MGDIWDGTVLLGVKAVIAKRFERSQRAHLVGMGALPLSFVGGDLAAGLGLDGTETLDFAGLDRGGGELMISAKKSRCLGTDLPDPRAVQHTGRMGQQSCPPPVARTGPDELPVPGLNALHGLRELTALTPTVRTDSAN